MTMGVVDGVVPEPAGGTESDHVEAASILRIAPAPYPIKPRQQVLAFNR